MKPQRDCADFRERLERALLGSSQTGDPSLGTRRLRALPEDLQQLSWHEHLLGCSPCRELLEREEALETLLATLPEPQLPPELSRRVLLRLRGAGDDHLDALLELAHDLPTPVGLAGRVLAGARAEQALDALLERDVVAVPPGLSARVLASLEPAPVIRAARSVWPQARRAFALAAGVGFALFAWWTLRESRPIDPAQPNRAVVDSSIGSGEAELIAFLERSPEAFDMLESPLVWGSDSELDLALGASIAVGDESLFGIDFEPARLSPESSSNQNR